jgi:SAM-dependent methyltransferase
VCNRHDATRRDQVADRLASATEFKVQDLARVRNRARRKTSRLFDDRSFDFVFATNNVIDTLSHEDRLQALREANRVLRSGGILAFSSHNIHHKKAFRGPRLVWSSNPVRLAYNFAQYLFCWWNYSRVAPLRRITPDYALLNDPGHYYACLHYYVARSTVDSQLTSVGLRLSDVFETHGQVTSESQDDSEHPSLFYVAKRVA